MDMAWKEMDSCLVSMGQKNAFPMIFRGHRARSGGQEMKGGNLEKANMED